MTSLAPFSPTSPALDNEIAVIAMERALMPLSVEWINNANARSVAYVRADIDAKHVAAFDKEALRRALMRRALKKKVVETA